MKKETIISIFKIIEAELKLPADKIEIQMTRMGGGFGRRAYAQYMHEAARISQKLKAPVKLIYTREDDMTYGIYRPMYTATYRAALDADKNALDTPSKSFNACENSCSSIICSRVQRSGR